MSNYDVRCARNIEEYREGWNRHIDSLSVLGLKAGVAYEDFKKVEKELKLWLELACVEILRAADAE